MKSAKIITSLKDIVDNVSPLEFDSFVKDLRSWHLAATENKTPPTAMVWHDDGLVGKKE